jgi:hypothetical protein
MDGGGEEAGGCPGNGMETDGADAGGGGAGWEALAEEPWGNAMDTCPYAAPDHKVGNAAQETRRTRFTG